VRTSTPEEQVKRVARTCAVVDLAYASLVRQLDSAGGVSALAPVLAPVSAYGRARTRPARPCSLICIVMIAASLEGGVAIAFKAAQGVSP